VRIYLDHNATTPLRPQVVEAMTEALRETFGNPSSVYAEGAQARARVETARSQVASLLGTAPGCIQFTGGATESNNTILFGALSPGDHVVTTQVEHPSVVAPLDELESRAVEVSRVAPDESGCVGVDAIEAALRPATRLVSMIWANNETGSIQPVEEVASLCASRGIALHVDATQAIAKAPIDLGRIRIDYVSSSAHKLGGPKGVGALVTGSHAETLPSFLRGGGQERGRRGGTENVVGIIGYGVACALASEAEDQTAARNARLRDRLWQGFEKRVPEIRWNGDPRRMLTNTLNVEFRGIAGEVLLQALDLEGVAVSAGAACHSGSIDPSKVLLAMGRTPEEARASLRFSVGHGVDEAQIDRVIELVAELVPRVRAMEAP
jgi:cysteine desulfurase